MAHSLCKEVGRAALVHLGEVEIKIEFNCSQELHEGHLKKKQTKKPNQNQTQLLRSDRLATRITSTKVCLGGSARTLGKNYSLGKFCSTEVSGGNLQESLSLEIFEIWLNKCG